MKGEQKSQDKICPWATVKDQNFIGEEGKAGSGVFLD